MSIIILHSSNYDKKILQYRLAVNIINKVSENNTRETRQYSLGR